MDAYLYRLEVESRTSSATAAAIRPEETAAAPAPPGLIAFWTLSEELVAFLASPPVLVAAFPPSSPLLAASILTAPQHQNREKLKGKMQRPTGVMREGDVIHRPLRGVLRLTSA